MGSQSEVNRIIQSGKSGYERRFVEMKTQKNNLSFIGIHRAGNDLANCYLDNYPLPQKMVAADPKGHRAEVFARRWAERGVDAIGYAEPGEIVVNRLDGDYVCMLTVDSVLPMIKIIQGTSMPIQWQILSRSTGGMVVGFAGTITRDDEDNVISSSMVLKDLSTYSIDISSENMNTSFLQSASLKSERKVVSRHSAENLSRLLEGRGESGLRIFLGPDNYPLVAIKGEPAPFREIERRSLEFDHPKISDAKEYAVAYAIANRVELFLIEKFGQKKGVKFYATFGEPFFSPELVSLGAGSGQVKTLVTD
jgi:hypothetical protein